MSDDEPEYCTECGCECEDSVCDECLTAIAIVCASYLEDEQ